VRGSPWFLAAILIAGCRPSATVQRTMPVANLQAYRTVALRVKSTTFASQGQAMYLERAVQKTLAQRCSFHAVAPDQAAADVVLDLNITNRGRGGSGWLSNGNRATIDTLLVLSDGQTGDLLGTASIRGESSGMIISNEQPEAEAINVVAKTIADLLSKSGCGGPRIAKVEPPAPAPVPEQDPGPDRAAPPDPTRLAEADALNEQGKEKIRNADVPGALAAFQQANALVPDARYVFNICIVFETQQQWDQAIAACRQARGMNPQPALLTKIDQRIDRLQQHP
jgi:hypothetical protein